MSEDFKPIETQEDFDAAIKDRIERAKTSVRSEFADYEDLKAKSSEFEAKQAELTASLAEKESSIAELQAKLTAYETDSGKREAARKYNLPDGMEKFLSGTDKTEWEAAAKELSKLTSSARPNLSKNYAEPVDDEPQSMGARLARRLHSND